MIHKLVFILLIVVSLLLIPFCSVAQGATLQPPKEETIEAVVTKVTNEKLNKIC